MHLIPFTLNIVVVDHDADEFDKNILQGRSAHLSTKIVQIPLEFAVQSQPAWEWLTHHQLKGFC